MGFGASGATGILLVGVVIHLGAFSAGYFSLQQTLHEATRAADTHALAVRHGELEYNNHSYDAGSQTLRVNVTNVGSVVFDASSIDLLLDGDVATSAITSWTVEDATTNVWAPETRLEVFASPVSDPVAIVVVAPTGASAFWRL